MTHMTLIAGLQKNAELAGDGALVDLCANALMGERDAIQRCLILCQNAATERAIETLDLAKVEIDLAIEKLIQKKDLTSAIRDLVDAQACLMVVLKKDISAILDSIQNPSRADELAILSLKSVNDDRS
jgi:hypothetical protein